MLTGKGSRQKKKKCVKATAYPCGFTCIARRLPNGKEQICHNVLRNQAKTATLWLKLVEEKLGAINKERIARGKTSLYANSRSRLTPATASTISPVSSKEVLQSRIKAIKDADREVLEAFNREKENRKSSVMLTALGKEIDRRNAAQKPKAQPKINPDDQRRLNSLTIRLPNAITNSEREEIKRDIADIEVLNPGIKPQPKPTPSAFIVNQYGGWYNGQYIKPGQGMTRKENGKWVTYPREVADRLMGKKPSTTKPWEQTYEDYRKENYQELVRDSIGYYTAIRDEETKLYNRAKSEGRSYVTDEAHQKQLNETGSAIASFKSVKSYDDAVKAWEKHGDSLPRKLHQESVRIAIAEKKPVPESVAKEYHTLNKERSDRMMGKKPVETPTAKPKWEQTFDEYKRENWKELAMSDLEEEIKKKARTIHLDKVAKSEGRMFLSESALKSDLERSDKAIAGLRNAKSYEDVAKVWENSRSLLPKQFHEEALKKAIADGKKIPDEVLKDYPDLIKAKPVLRTGPKPQQKSSGVTSKQKSLAAIVVGELLNAQSDRIENSAIAMIDHLKKQGDTDTANRMQRVIDRIADDDSDKMTRWVLDHQDLTPPKLRFNLDKIESSLGIGKPSSNTPPKTPKPTPKPKDLKSVHKVLEKEADDALNCLLG